MWHHTAIDRSKERERGKRKAGVRNLHISLAFILGCGTVCTCLSFDLSLCTLVNCWCRNTRRVCVEFQSISCHALTAPEEGEGREESTLVYWGCLGIWCPSLWVREVLLIHYYSITWTIGIGKDNGSVLLTKA